MYTTLVPNEQDKTWEVKKPGQEKTGFLVVRADQWFQVFRDGAYNGVKFEWMQPPNNPDKRVTFAENVGAQ